MAKLYYGGGKCSIEGNEIRGVEIRYTGAIEIEDKTDNNFAIAQKGNGIMIFPIGAGFLSELFDYEGEFKITSVIVADNNAERVSTTIHRVMDYSELLGTSESITTKSEDLKVSNVSGRKVNKTALKQQYIENLSTSNTGVELYDRDGNYYEGIYKINLSNSEVTAEDGSVLYYKGGRATKNESGVPYATVLQNRIQKQTKIQNRRRQRSNNVTRTQGGAY